MRGRSLQALVAARNLGRHGVEVIGCDEAPLMALSFSRYVSDTFVHPPVTGDPGVFLEGLLDHIQRLRPEDDRPYVLLPVSRETHLISRFKRHLEPHIKVAAPDQEAVTKVHPKNHLIETARHLQVPIPKTWRPADEAELDELLEEIDLPAFVKVPDGTGGVGIEKVDTRDHLQEAYRRITTQLHAVGERALLVQQAVPGEDYCVTALFNQGRLRAQMVYRNLETFPKSSGFGVLRQTIDAPYLVELTERLLGPLNWNGVAEVDFRSCGGDFRDARLIEVNPRFWGGLFQSVESGVEYPWLLYQLMATGECDDAAQPLIGLKTRMPVLTVVALLEDLAGPQGNWDRFQQTCQQIWDDLSVGDLAKAGEHLLGWVGDALDPSSRIHSIQRWFEQNENATTELFSSDDPLATLGVLYLLGSLAQHGRLPEELSRSEDSKD